MAKCFSFFFFSDGLVQICVTLSQWFSHKTAAFSTEQCTSPSKSHEAVPFRHHFFFTLRMRTNHYGRGSKPCSLCEEDSLADSVLNHVFARHGDEMGLVGACNGDWVMEHLKELDINFLAKFCNVFHTFWACVLLMYCVKSMIVSCSLWASWMNLWTYSAHLCLGTQQDANTLSHLS